MVCQVCNPHSIYCNILFFNFFLNSYHQYTYIANLIMLNIPAVASRQEHPKITVVPNSSNSKHTQVPTLPTPHRNKTEKLVRSVPEHLTPRARNKNEKSVRINPERLKRALKSAKCIRRAKNEKKCVRFNTAPKNYYFNENDPPKKLLPNQLKYRQMITEVSNPSKTTTKITAISNGQVLETKKKVIDKCTSQICQEIYDTIIETQKSRGIDILEGGRKLRYKVYLLQPKNLLCEKCSEWQLTRFGIRCFINNSLNKDIQVDLHYQDFFICIACNRYAI